MSEAELDARSAGIGPDDVINTAHVGTTGFPKASLSSRNIVNNGGGARPRARLHPGRPLCLCVPLFHCFGCVIGVLGAFTTGACPVVRRPDACSSTATCTVYGCRRCSSRPECPGFKRTICRRRTGVMPARCVRSR